MAETRCAICGRGSGASVHRSIGDGDTAWHTFVRGATGLRGSANPLPGEQQAARSSFAPGLVTGRSSSASSSTVQPRTLGDVIPLEVRLRDVRSSS